MENWIIITLQSESCFKIYRKIYMTICLINFESWSKLKSYDNSIFHKKGDKFSGHFLKFCFFALGRFRRLVISKVLQHMQSSGLLYPILLGFAQIHTEGNCSCSSTELKKNYYSVQNLTIVSTNPHAIFDRLQIIIKWKMGKIPLYESRVGI